MGAPHADGEAGPGAGPASSIVLRKRLADQQVRSGEQLGTSQLGPMQEPWQLSPTVGSHGGPQLGSTQSVGQHEPQ